MTDSEMAQANLQSELDRSSKWHNGYAPWWNTMKEDPWWMTTGKAILGEKEFSDLAGSHVWRKSGPDLLSMVDPAMARPGGETLQFKRDILPVIDTLAPLLFMGKGGRMMEGAVPRPTGSILKGGIEKVTDFGWPFWWGEGVKFPPADPFHPTLTPPSGSAPKTQWGDLFTRGLLPGQTKGATSPVDIEGLGYVEPPFPRGKLTGKDIELPPSPVVEESVGDPAGGWNWYSPKKPPELGPTASAMDDPIVQEYLKHLGVDPNDVPVPPPYVSESTPEYLSALQDHMKSLGDFVQSQNAGPTWEQLTPSQKQWYQDQWNQGALPPRGNVPEPYSVQDVANIHELGLKTPERSPGEIQQDWLNFINNIISGDSHQLPGGLEGLGNPKKMRPMYDYTVDPNTYPPPRIAPTPPPEDFDFSQYGYDLPPAPFLVA